MTIIKINGGFWGWEPIETLERLYPLFEQYTLDPIYEWYGNFVNRNDFFVAIECGQKAVPLAALIAG
jgi:hypothetical protein